MASFPFTLSSYETITDTQDVIERTAWDIVKLGNFVLPGISIVDSSRARKMVIKNPKDNSYASVKDSGLELAKVTITNICAYKEQFNKLVEIIKFFNTQLGVKANIKRDKNKIFGFPISHPQTEIMGINSVYITNISAPKATRPGYITTIFECIEVKEIKKVETRKIDPNANFVEKTAYDKKNTTPKPSQTPSDLAPKKK